MVRGLLVLGCLVVSVHAFGSEDPEMRYRRQSAQEARQEDAERARASIDFGLRSIQSACGTIARRADGRLDIKITKQPYIMTPQIFANLEDGGSGIYTGRPYAIDEFDAPFARCTRARH